MLVLRVLHLVGAADSEFYDKLSRFYAPYCLDQTANPALYEFHIAYISPGRNGVFPPLSIRVRSRRLIPCL